MNSAHAFPAIPPELATELKLAAETGRSVRIEIDDQAYELTVNSVAECALTNIWAGYDAERFRSALRRNAALPERIEPEALDDMLADIRAQRGQNSFGRPSR